MRKNNLRKTPLESWEQRQLCSWWDDQVCKTDLKYWAKFLFHIPNGTQAASRMQRQGLGVRSGVPDLFLCIPSGKYHGLFIELKRAIGGKPSPEQIEFIYRARKLGYSGYVVHGALNAEFLITQYLTLPEALPEGLVYNPEVI